MNPRLSVLLQPCFRRTLSALRWIAYVCGGGSIVLLVILGGSLIAAPAITAGHMLVLGFITLMLLGSAALYWHQRRIEGRLHRVFFEMPTSVVKIEAKVIQSGPVIGRMFHIYAPPQVKMVGLSVPDQATFDELRTLLPRHFENAGHH